jgi:hypothetical protein
LVEPHLKPPAEKVFISDNLQRILVCLCSVCVVILFPFLQTFALNVSNLQSPLASLIQPVAMVGGISFVSLYLVLRILSPKREVMLQSLLMFIVLVAWLQTYFFVGDFGFLDGRPPDWEGTQLISFFQLLLEIGLLVFFFTRSLTLFQNIKFVSFLILMSSIISLYPHFQTLFGENTKKYAFNENKVFDFSSSKNVLIILVDTLQSDVFNEVLEEQAELKSSLEGFTYFRNAVSAFSKTYASVPAILSGTVFDNSTTLPKYLDEAYKERSLPSALLKQDFDVRLHSFAPYSLEAHPQVALNISGTKGSALDYTNSLQKDLVLLINLLTFKLSPHVFKEWIYNDGRFRIPIPVMAPSVDKCQLDDSLKDVSAALNNFDTRFFDEFRHCANASIEAPVFRYFHISGAHAPFQFGEKFQHIGQQKVTRKNFKVQVEGVFYQLSLLLKKMKELGVYDNATIVVLGDHGGGDLAVELNLNQSNIPRRPEPHSTLSKQKVMGGIPALLYKPMNSNDDLSISDVPVSLTDVARTISDELGYKDALFPGENLFQVEPSSTRTRFHKYYEFSGWDIDYILPLTEFTVDGFSWYPESWRPSKRNLNVITDKNFTGLMISMVKGGNLGTYSAGGWETSQESGTKIGESEARLNLSKSFEEDLVVQVVHQSFPASSAFTETITVSLDKSSLGEWSFKPGDGQRRKMLVIPKKLSHKLKAIPLVLASNKAASKVNIKEVSVFSPDIYAYNLGEDIDFSITGFGKKHLTYGWSTADRRGVYSLGHESGLLLMLGSSPKVDLELRIDLDALVFESWNEQGVIVFVNHEKIEEMVFRDTRSHQVSLKLPLKLFENTRLMDIRFEYENAIQPATLGRSTDTRYLAVALNSVVVSDWNEELFIKPVFAKTFQLLDKDGINSVVDSQGKLYPLGASLKGYLDGVNQENQQLTFSGWAINAEVPADKLSMVLFRKNKSPVVRSLNAKRPDVAVYFKESQFVNSGYSFSIPTEILDADESMKLFIVSDLGYSAEVAFPEGFRSTKRKVN